jgi:ribosomal protein L9
MSRKNSLFKVKVGYFCNFITKTEFGKKPNNFSIYDINNSKKILFWWQATSNQQQATIYGN